MITRREIVAAALAIAATGVQAQSHGHSHAAPNGGQLVNIGKFEVELVATRQEIKLYLTDEKEKKLPSSDFTATATVLAQGNQQRTVELKPTGDNVLSAKYDFTIEGKFRATVSLKSKDKEIGRGRFNTDLKR